MPPAPSLTDARPALQRTLGFWQATGVMLGIIIGSGIFATPTQIANSLASPWLILALWVLGGIISLLGALTFAELASMLPQSGGIYVFLREGFGRAGRPLAFIFGWTYLLISKPTAAAGISIIFGTHACQLLHLDPSPTNTRIVTSAALICLTVVNILGVAFSANVAALLTALKVGALALFACLGLFAVQASPAAFEALPVAEANAKPLLLAIAAAMAGILWTYDGWADVGALAGEIKNPARQIARTFLFGTLLITALYVAANAAFLRVIPLDEMRATETVAPLFAERVLGPAGAFVATALIVVATFGSTHGSIMTGARVSFAQSRDGLLFAFLGTTHRSLGTPVASLLFQLALSLTALWALPGFSQMAGGFVFTIWIFYGLAGLALFTLRRARPDAPRPFRCPGYPLVPALFVLAAASMTTLAIIEDPAMNLLWVAILAAGLPVYAIWSRFAPPTTREPAAH